MSKIRTLKAEFFRDEDLSPNLVTKVLAAGLICTLADDEGRFKASTGVIRGEIFTHDHVNDEEISEALAHLEETGFIRLYQVNSKRFGLISNWKRHQPVPPTRFITSTLPPPPKQAPRKQGASTPQAPDKQGASGKERKGIGREEEEEGIGGESEGRTADAPLPVPAEPERNSSAESQKVQTVWNAYERSLPPNTRKKLTAGRQQLIKRRLKDYSVEDLSDAVQGWQYSPFHRGENDEGRIWNDLELILRIDRKGNRIEFFRDLQRGINRPAAKPNGLARREHPTDARVRELQERAARLALQEASE